MYTVWCDQCGWNLQPYAPEPPRTIFESLYVAIGKRHGQALFEKMTKAEVLKPTVTLSKLLAVSIALGVHGLTFLFAVWGIIFLIGGWPNLFAIFFGLAGLAIAWVLFPRFPKLDGEIAARDEFPTLYKIVDDISQALDTSKVSGIVFFSRYNAAFSQIGWQRKKILYLGVPLFSVLSGQERIALLAHELAHGVNGDPARSFFVGTAVYSLGSWYSFLRPDGLIDHNPYGLLAIPVNFVMLLLSGLAWSGAYGLSHLLWRGSQRAEYLADYLGAKIAGTEAMLSMLRKFYFGDGFGARARAILSGLEDEIFFDVLRTYVSTPPPRELERIKRVEQLPESRLDMTHPPTVYRVGFLEAHPIVEAQIRLEPALEEQLARELIPVQQKLQRDWLKSRERNFYY